MLKVASLAGIASFSGNKNGKRILLLFCILSILLVFSQLTRFENQLKVNYDGENVTATMGAEEIRFQYSDAAFDKVSVRFQESVIGENGLRRLTVTDASGNKVFDYSRQVFYLFDADVFGTMFKGRYDEVDGGYLRRDVWLKGNASRGVYLHNATLPASFDLRADFVGRGYKSLRLWGAKNVTFEIYDGLVKNMFCISKGITEFSECVCQNADCILSYNDNREPLWWNVKRVLNLGIEILFVSFLIIFITVMASGWRMR
jgi:hypothetical protein